MIPTVFVSSTVKDLHYLRDGLRDAILELGYQPIMSDRGEVCYLNPKSAADSCYQTVRECHFVVLIIGKRYGDPGTDGLSVTHKEWLTAQEYEIPTITFVEPQVLSYKDVFNADRNATLWDAFPSMDYPRKTFQLLDEIGEAAIHNGIIPFTSVGDAKLMLKTHIANYVGGILADAIGPMSPGIREVLAQITTLRNQLTRSSKSSSSKERETKRYLVATRLLLNDYAVGYRRFLSQVFGDLDIAIGAIVNCVDFKEVMTVAKHTATISVPQDVRSLITDAMSSDDETTGPRPLYGSLGDGVTYAIFSDKRVVFSEDTWQAFDNIQKKLNAEVRNCSVTLP